jgi:methylphosphotriester-DNA--protein-cysteine methyltransferase
MVTKPYWPDTKGVLGYNPTSPNGQEPKKKNSVSLHGYLTEALDNGYYDQSHFIKSCLRITGLTPKKLFRHLSEQVTDTVIVE